MVGQRGGKVLGARRRVLTTAARQCRMHNGIKVLSLRHDIMSLRNWEVRMDANVCWGELLGETASRTKVKGPRHHPFANRRLLFANRRLNYFEKFSITQTKRSRKVISAFASTWRRCDACRENIGVVRCQRHSPRRIWWLSCKRSVQKKNGKAE